MLLVYFKNMKHMVSYYFNIIFRKLFKRSLSECEKIDFQETWDMVVEEFNLKDKLAHEAI